MQSPVVPAPSTGRPKFAPDDGFRRELDRRVNAYFDESGLSRHGDWRMYLKTAVLLGAFAASYALLVFAATAWWHAVLLSGGLAMSMAGIGFSVMHDANHGAYSKRASVNKVLERTLDMLGVSSYVWRWKHNVFHHTYTNIDGVDHDIYLAPFVRLAPTQPRRWAHRFQHIYIWALYGFTVFHMHYFLDFSQFFTGRIGGHKFPRPGKARTAEVFAAKAFVLGWSIALPLFFHTWWVVLAVYAGLWFVSGLILGVVFQLAHCVAAADFPTVSPSTGRIERSWAAHQVETTVDFAHGNRLLTWYVGGLNYQIEHHLFPQVCHLHYPKIAGIVREVSEEYGVRYTAHPRLSSALKSHGAWVRRMGEQPAQAVATQPLAPRFEPATAPRTVRPSQ